MKNWAARLSIVLLLGYLSAAYLSPAFTPLINGETDRVMGDGTDSATLPYMYGTLIEILFERPAELFYGAVPTRHLNPPEGFALWIPWSERFLALAAASVTPLEHVSTVYVWLIVFFNALCMFALGRALGWPRALALGIAIAWAFCPFTRGRAQVHAGFAGTYHVPLAMLSLMWALNGRGRKSLAAAALGFLLVGMAPHYFVITLAFVSPLITWAAWNFSAQKNARAVVRVVAALTPMILLLGWCYFNPLPGDLIASGAAAQPPSGQTEGGGPHTFLTRYAAHPVDYFTGDIALGADDWNPPRESLTRGVLENIGGSNPHERANGIRWSIWLMVLCGLFYWPAGTRRARAAVLVLGLFSFWLSLPPDALGFIDGPSYWLYSIISQIRVPSRAGIYVHFSALLFAGIFVSRFKGKYLWAFPLIMIADLPPYLQEMQTAKVRPQLSSLAGGDCGAGIYFPYVAGNWGVLQDYHFLQEMRGTDCDLVNRQWPDAASEKLRQSFGLSQRLMDDFNAQRPESTDALERVVQCAPLSWIVFDPQTNPPARAWLCARLGWQMTEARVCKGPAKPLTKNPAECL